MATFSGLSFTDTNGNGVRDAGEAGLAGISVTLTGTDSVGNSVSLTTATIADGSYSFAGVADSNATGYTVTFGNSDGATTYTHTQQDQGGDDTVDSDANVTTGATASFVVDSSHQTFDHVDAGFYSLVSIGNSVFKDLNTNGRQDAGEPGVAGVTVELLNASSTVLATTTTDPSGHYLFANVAPGSYKLEFVAPPGYVFTAKDAAVADDATDSDADPATGVTDVFAITSGANISNVDAGMYAPPVISGLNGDTATFTEGGPVVFLDNPATPAVVTDADSPNFDGGNLTATVTNVVAGEDVVGIATDSTVTLSNNTSVGSEVRVDGGSGLVLIGTIASGGTGSGGEPLVVTFNGAATPDLVSILSHHLVYSDTNQGDIDTTTRAIHVSIADGTGDTGSADVTVNVVGVNDAPTLTATAANPTFAENSAPATLYSGADASTVESGQTITSMTLTVAGLADGANELLFIDGSNVALTNGNSIVTATNGLTVHVSVSGSTATATFTGASLSANAFDTLVNGLGYSDSNDTPATTDRTVTITEIVDSGAGTSPDVNTTALNIASTVHVTATDDAPVLTGFGDTPAYIENGAPVLLDVNSNATVSDPELNVSANHYQGASLTIVRDGGANPDDLFAGTGSLDLVDVNGNGENVSLDGGATFIGTFFNPGDGSVTFDFNANATAADIDSVMRQIVYSNASDNPPATVPIDFILNDGSGQPGGQDQGTGTGVSTATINVQITQVDDAPTLLNVASTQGYVVGSAGVTLSPALVVFDPDATPPSPLTGIANARVAITSGFQATDQLFVKLPTSGGFFIVDDGSGAVVTNISVASDAGGVLILSGTDTTQHYQLVLDAVNYSSSAADPTAGGTDPGRTIDWQVNDGLLSSPTPGPDVNETLLNFVTAPQVDLDASGAGTGFSTTFTENGAPLAITDTDVSVTAPGVANLETATIVLTDAKAGDSLSIAGSLPGGIDATIDTSVAGKITMHLSNSASVADYQTALGQIRFVNSSDNPDTTDRDITVQVTGDEADSNVAHATVHVVAVNDPPVNTVPGSFVGVISQPTALNGLSVGDPDAISLTTQLHVDHGVLNVGTPGGGATVSGSGTATVTLTGSVAQIDATLHAANNVVYQTNFTFAGTDHLTMTSNDGGSSGTGGPMTDTDTVVINVSAPAIGGSAGVVSGSPGVTSPAATFAGDSFAFSHVDLHGFHLI